MALRCLVGKRRRECDYPLTFPNSDWVGEFIQTPLMILDHHCHITPCMVFSVMCGIMSPALFCGIC
jgi:hypothetical protein